MFNQFIRSRLERYAVKYFQTHPDVKLVVVTGTVGKTSTKVAIATVLSKQYRVRTNSEEPGTSISAPLSMLGIELPQDSLSPIAWWKVFRAAKQRIKQPADVDVIVQELASSRPGDIAAFGSYLKPDVAIVTAVSMKNPDAFGSLDAIAAEELEVTNFSKIAIINRDDIDGKYASLLKNPNIDTYGTSGLAEYSYVDEDFSLENGHKGYLNNPDFEDPIATTVHLVGEHNVRAAVAAAAVGARFGMDAATIANGMESIIAMQGRMNVLRGVSSAIIIDDTYGADPLSTERALQTLSNLAAPQKIAVLGSMDDLGSLSGQQHARIGQLCTPDAIDWVVTVGKDAGQYLAPAAQANGCFVKVCRDSLEAGAFVHSMIEKGGIVLLKGGKTGVFVEEAVKILLHTNADDKQLIRQTAAWLEAKSIFFSKFNSEV